MRFSLNLIALVALLGLDVLAAPLAVRQGAGVGAGCDSIVSDADTMLGEASRGQGENLANILRRQGAGVGAACNSIVSDADTMLGEASRGQGKNIASMLNTRQLNGIADGLTAVTAKVPGAESASESLDTELNNVDGYGTQGSADVGEEIGNIELGIGKSVGGSNGETGGTGGAAPAPAPAPAPGPAGGPGHKRQLNGIADGITAVTAKVPGASSFSESMDSFLNTVDGQGTDDSAELGKIVGDQELGIGSAVGGANGGGSTAPPPPRS